MKKIFLSSLLLICVLTSLIFLWIFIDNKSNNYKTYLVSNIKLTKFPIGLDRLKDGNILIYNHSEAQVFGPQTLKFTDIYLKDDNYQGDYNDPVIISCNNSTIINNERFNLDINDIPISTQELYNAHFISCDTIKCPGVNHKVIPLQNNKGLFIGAKGRYEYYSKDNWIYNFNNNKYVSANKMHYPISVRGYKDLNNGIVFIFGVGKNNKKEEINRIEIFDTIKTRFYLPHNYNNAISVVNTILLKDGRVFILGSYKQKKPNPRLGEREKYDYTSLPVAAIYDPKTNVFQQIDSKIDLKPNFISPTQLILLNSGKVLILSYKENSRGFNKITFFDPLSMKFIHDKNTAVYRNAAITLLPNDKVLFFGGTEGGDGWRRPHPQKAITLYDTNTHEFKTLGNMRKKRSYAKSVLLPNNNVLIVGGDSSEGKGITAEIFNFNDTKF